MDVSGIQLDQLHKALLSAFPSRSAIEQMVAFGLDERLYNIANENGSPLPIVVFELIQWARATGRLTDLIRAAVRQNPANSELSSIARELTKEAESSGLSSYKW